MSQTTGDGSNAADPQRPIEEVEERLRCMGHLGAREALSVSITRDDLVVRRLGFTHAEIAGPMNDATEQMLRNYDTKLVVAGGSNFEVASTVIMQMDECPYDGYEETAMRVELDQPFVPVPRGGSLPPRTDDDRYGWIKFRKLLAHTIEHHGFYGGFASRIRVPPEEIVRAFRDLRESVQVDVVEVCEGVNRELSLAPWALDLSTAYRHGATL